ncbi:Sushi, nidogen and EGF-like domain-containing protein 1 [Anabarilius grahami]|uniref:Sushi, nidogen and EGF-like domain-containing protein 1 n=1 Tax=Anabarilius grahami TaxID=495550 RepID=A0A3N0XH79_ANAGA|nr:Sushi, nidogen and EGF-like domain-containing protein 1 [Anabarilius grahami]
MQWGKEPESVSTALNRALWDADVLEHQKVNNNGHLTFTQPLSAYVPYLNTGIDIIAPLWTDLFNVNGGTISYREDTSSAVLAQVTEAVHQYYPNVPFTASSAFVATWDSVPYITGGGSVTFQVVLVSNGERSFILINYGDIAETGQVWLAGYDTVDSVNSFQIPAASAPELSFSSNINVNGRWSFRVDGSPNLPANFLPFGDGDVVNPISDDGSSEAIFLQQPFKYFGRVYNQIYVNNNGHLTFTEPLSAFVPYVNAGIDIIAPLWTDLFNVNGGTISYREDTSSAVLAQVTEAVHQYYPNVPFTASSAFVATWDSVPYITGGGSVTFQVVLVSNGERSFILINYGDIAETGQVWLAGYDTVDSVNSFQIPAASAPELSFSSNINVNGRWSFRVDGSPNLPANFLPFGDGDVVNPISDDGSSEAIFLQQPFKYFGRVYNQIYVNNNGHLTFTEPLSAFVPYVNAGIDIIAPLWTDLFNVNGGTISYREDTSSAVLAQVTEAVHQYYPNVPFTASSAFVATWDSVPYITGGGSVTFQVVLVSNGERSFILINYGDIAETGQVWLAGYDTVDSVNSFQIPAASAPELSFSSNINVNGRWSFRVDGSPNLPANFLPFGDGDVVNPISDDGSSEAIFLQQPFKYFGRVYNQIYVNNNGHLTFTEPLSAFVPYVNAGIDIIAPLWTDLFNVNGGTISYREDTSSAVLAQVTEAVHQYYPNVPFTASSAFVATWDSVPYITGGGSVTFQVVLVSNGERSFILINYGDIAETGQVWLAGYDTVDSVNSFQIPAASAPELSFSSNINVNGRWSFRVDGSPNLPANFLPFGDGDVVNPISDDGSSEAIFLQQPFKYFGRVYNQIYVNNNGHLTFTEPLSAYVPYLNAGIDIIAPLWTDLFNVNGGTISYREDTSSAVLAQVTEAVHQYYPNVPFTASSAFVATWDSVPYITGGGLVTFQVVLVSNGERSFILINYGDIAETGQVWLAGFDTVDSSHSFAISLVNASELSSSSNVNDNGRWVFHVDGGHDVCDTCTENEACQQRGGVYGCVCLDGQQPNHEIFGLFGDAISTVTERFLESKKQAAALQQFLPAEPRSLRLLGRSSRSRVQAPRKDNSRSRRSSQRARRI